MLKTICATFIAATLLHTPAKAATPPVQDEMQTSFEAMIAKGLGVPQEDWKNLDRDIKNISGVFRLGIYTDNKNKKHISVGHYTNAYASGNTYLTSAGLKVSKISLALKKFPHLDKFDFVDIVMDTRAPFNKEINYTMFTITAPIAAIKSGDWDGEHVAVGVYAPLGKYTRASDEGYNLLVDFCKTRAEKGQLQTYIDLCNQQ